MPAKDVKAYVKRNKNDAADAEAICEAVRRPTIITQSHVVSVEVIEHTKFYPHSSTIPPCALVPPRRLVDRSRALATHVWSRLV